MNRTETEEKNRTRRRRSTGGRRMLTRLLIVALVILIGFLLVRYRNQIAPEPLLDWASIRFGDGKAGTGYPYSISGNTVVGFEEVGEHLAVATDTSLLFLDGNASQVDIRQHAYTNPAFRVAGSYVLIAEIGGNRFQLETRRGTALTMKLENRTLYTADVTSSGMVGVVTDAAAQNYLCGIQVYTGSGTLKYEYKSGKYLITALSLAGNGHGMAAVGTTAEKGKIKSVLLMFDFSKPEPVEYADTDVMLYAVNYFDNGNVAAIGDTAWWFLKRGADSVTVHQQDSLTVVGFAASRTTMALAVRPSGSPDGGAIQRWESDGRMTQSEEFSGGFRHVSCQNHDIVLLSDAQLLRLPNKEQAEVYDTPYDGLMAISYRDKPLLLTLSDLQLLSKNK